MSRYNDNARRQDDCLTCQERWYITESINHTFPESKFFSFAVIRNNSDRAETNKSKQFLNTL